MQSALPVSVPFIYCKWCSHFVQSIKYFRLIFIFATEITKLNIAFLTAVTARHVTVTADIIMAAATARHVTVTADITMAAAAT